jgi:hypothetical protein
MPSTTRSSSTPRATATPIRRNLSVVSNESTSEPQSESTIGGDLRDLLRHVAQPVIDQIDGRLRSQIDVRVDERVDERVEAMLADKLALIERAVADLDRAVRELQEKLNET